MRKSLNNKTVELIMTETVSELIMTEIVSELIMTENC